MPNRFPSLASLFKIHFEDFSATMPEETIAYYLVGDFLKELISLHDNNLEAYKRAIADRWMFGTWTNSFVIKKLNVICDFLGLSISHFNKIEQMGLARTLGRKCSSSFFDDVNDNYREISMNEKDKEEYNKFLETNRGNMTDSETFFRDIFIPIFGRQKANYSIRKDNVIGAVLGKSKMVFYKEGRILTYGDFITPNPELDVHFSNDSFKNVVDKYLPIYTGKYKEYNTIHILDTNLNYISF